MTGRARRLDLPRFCKLLEGTANRVLGWRLGPDRQPSSEPVTQDFLAEVVLMLPLHIRHREKAVHIFRPAATERIPRRVFIFANVAALQLSGAVHGNQPAAHMTDEGDR